jgi:uncharacterized metal-binding protein YceD (DUF177 family)
VAAGNELSRAYLIDPLPEDGIRFAIEASAGERAALARRFGLLALDLLAAAGRIVRGPLPRSVLVEGRLEAGATQSCVVTLEPVPAEPSAAFRRLFVPSTAPEPEVEVDALGDDAEPLTGPRLDVGEIVAEELALALDPYPHAPGADVAAAAGNGETRGPFDVLARLSRG